MIIYKIQESGKATDFQHSRKCPDGWLSISGDIIPVDISQYNTETYTDRETSNDKARAEKTALESARKMKGDLEIQGSTTAEATAAARTWYQEELERINLEYA